MRAAGSGLKTLVVMLMKDFAYGEVKCLDPLSPWIRLEQYGNDRFVFRKQPPAKEDIQAARLAVRRAREAMLSGEFDMVVLDEVCVAIYFGLLKTEEIVALLKAKPQPVEVILTGRYCPAQLIAMADLVTEMQEIKHYYQSGVTARKGIES